MNEQPRQSPAQSMVTFYHDIEQNLDSDADVSQCRRMVEEFLNIERDHKISVTYNVVGKIFEQQPDLIEKIQKAGQEVAFHSYQHYSDWRPRYYAEEIKLCRQVADQPAGYRSPQSRWNRKTLKTLYENGFLWNAEADPQQEPYFVYKGLVRLPIFDDDWPLHTHKMNCAQWVDRYKQSLHKRSYLAFGSHDFVTAEDPQQRLKAWAKVIETALNHGSVVATFSETADLFRRAACAKYYSDVSQDWNRDTQTLYRTKRFREMIRTAAEKLDRPVVADLGSGGGSLTCQLHDLAEKIYCIDNAPGMVALANSHNGVEGRLGEATNSNLPDKSCDLVICARVIEYLFWPDRLADEIRRIGKPGATYFVTFPVRQQKAPLNEGAPPDRIRRHYTPEQIKKWAELIGPGSLIGIQYDPAEPENPAQEQAYRRQEENPPQKILPTNWVYMGTIGSQPAPLPHRHLPLDAFEFRFPLLCQPDPWAVIKKIKRRIFRIARKLLLPGKTKSLLI